MGDREFSESVIEDYQNGCPKVSVIRRACGYQLNDDLAAARTIGQEGLTMWRKKRQNRSA